MFHNHDFNHNFTAFEATKSHQKKPLWKHFENNLETQSLNSFDLGALCKAFNATFDGILLAGIFPVCGQDALESNSSKLWNPNLEWRKADAFA